MENYEKARKEEQTKAEVLGEKRQEKALREFKDVLDNLIFLLRGAAEMKTAYMYWVNRAREQFVIETQSTDFDNVMFRDRMGFEEHFLNDFKDLDEPLTVEIGEDISASALSHYYDEVPVKYITILPFVNNGETVAVTVLESNEKVFTGSKTEIVFSYINALRNILNTYLEISDLYEQQGEWNTYELTLEQFSEQCHRAEMVKKLLNTLQSYLQDGGVSFISQGMGCWCNVMNADQASYSPPIGMQMAEHSMSYEAVNSGKTEFSIHLNNNPNRLSPRESHTEGASMAIPLMMKDRRQGIVLIHDKNPLLFKESIKHKFINLVRTAGLQMMANNIKLELDEPLLTNEYHAFLPDLWERSADAELNRLKENLLSHHSWVGLVTISNITELRTQLRIQELNQMQQDLVQAFNPGSFGYSGMLGYHSDYVYSFIIQSEDSEAVKKWSRSVKKKFSGSFKLSNDLEIDTDVKMGFLKLSNDYDDSYQLLNNAKSALSQAMNSNKNEAV